MVILLPALAFAQEGPPLTWTPVVGVRARALGSSGLDDASTTADSLTLAQRALVGVQVQRGVLSARVSFQEVRSWTSSESIVTGSFPASIGEGWARVQGELSPNIRADVTIGRQPIVVDEGRIVGAQPWEMEGQFLDALRARLTFAPFELEYVNARRFDPPSPDGTTTDEDPLGFGVNVIRGGIGREGPITRWQVDALSVVDARRTSVTTTTGGVYGRFDDGRWRSAAEVYVQGNPNGTGTLGAVNAGWVFGPDEGVTLRGGITIQSGDRDGAGPLAPWEPVLGDTHTFLGQLDLFASAPTTGDEPGDGGVACLSSTLDVRPWRAFSGTLAAQHFASPVDATRYGEELDMRARWSFTPFGALEGGWSHFLPNPAWRDEDVDWGYLDLDVAF